jgi:transposase-like protein
LYLFRSFGKSRAILCDFLEGPWQEGRTTKLLKRCYVELRRRTRPMVYFVNVASVDRIIYAISND